MVERSFRLVGKAFFSSSFHVYSATYTESRVLSRGKRLMEWKERIERRAEFDPILYE